MAEDQGLGPPVTHELKVGRWFLPPSLVLIDGLCEVPYVMDFHLNIGTAYLASIGQYPLSQQDVPLERFGVMFDVIPPLDLDVMVPERRPPFSGDHQVPPVSIPIGAREELGVPVHELGDAAFHLLGYRLAHTPIMVVCEGVHPRFDVGCDSVVVVQSELFRTVEHHDFLYALVHAFIHRHGFHVGHEALQMVHDDLLWHQKR